MAKITIILLKIGTYKIISLKYNEDQKMPTEWPTLKTLIRLLLSTSALFAQAFIFQYLSFFSFFLLLNITP